MEKNHYKAIIIGGGITGLSAGLAWTKTFDPKADPVLILEKQKVPGGCVNTFAREGYRFDTVQLIPEVSSVLKFFDIHIDMFKFDNNYARLFLADPAAGRAKIFPIPANRQRFQCYLENQFPQDKSGVNRFFDYCSKMMNELKYLKTEPRFSDIFQILIHCPKILGNSGKTYKQFLQSFHFKNPDLYEILDTFSSFSGLSGDRCAALLTACAMNATLEGTYRPRKGFIEFPVVLKKRFEEQGGEIRFGVEVEKILTKENTAVGVQLTDGQIISADVVISTADTQVTLGKMLGYDRLKSSGSRYGRKAQEAKMSPSALAIHLGLDDGVDLKALGFDCGYNLLTTGHRSHELIFDQWEKGQDHHTDECFHFGVISPSAVTGGKPNLILHVVPVGHEKWIRLREQDYEAYQAEKLRAADFFIDKVEQYMIPGLRAHIQFIDVSTPATYARYIGSPTGSNFDMMPVPGNFGKNRLGSRTPVHNLFLPKFSHGIWASLQGGLQVVDMISHGKIMGGNASYSE